MWRGHDEIPRLLKTGGSPDRDCLRRELVQHFTQDPGPAQQSGAVGFGNAVERRQQVMGFAPGILRALLKFPDRRPLRLRITCRQHPRIRKPAIQPGGNQFHQLPIGAGTKLREFFRVAFHLLQLPGSNQ